jgi:tRNA-modifying protein YgfZ
MTAIRLNRAAIDVSGPEAISWLQGQLSQDLRPLTVGRCAWSWLLNPSGKVDALVRVTRTGDESMVLDVDHGFGDAVIARLTRFKLRTKATVAPIDWHCIAVVGDGVADASTAVERDGIARVDLLGADVSAVAPEHITGTLTQYDQWRIEARWPAMGAELSDSTIPAETELIDLTVSFTKGCYTGQELVARLDARGSNVPRRLRRISGDGLAVGDELRQSDKTIGVVTTVVGHDALAYIGRAHDATVATLSPSDGPVVVIA